MTASLYDRLGGALAIQAVVLRLYRYILADAELSPFFKHINIERLIHSQGVFVSYAFGGSQTYTGQNMRDAHKSAVAKGLNDRHFDLVAGYLAQSMRDLNVADALVNEAIATVETTRNDVLNR